MRNLIAIPMICAAALAFAPAQAALVLVGQYDGNDCGGKPDKGAKGGTSGFSNCYASASGTSEGQPSSGGSAAIYKYNAGGGAEVSSLYPSITGSEFVIEFDKNTDILSFNYTPGVNDPSIHYFAIKQSNGFVLFYDVNPITAASIDLDLYFKGSDYSHITFFNGGATTPGPVPEPATWAMMIGGFAVVGASMRRRKRAVSFA